MKNLVKKLRQNGWKIGFCCCSAVFLLVSAHLVIRWFKDKDEGDVSGYNEKITHGSAKTKPVETVPKPIVVQKTTSQNISTNVHNPAKIIPQQHAQTQTKNVMHMQPEVASQSSQEQAATQTAPAATTAKKETTATTVTAAATAPAATAKKAQTVTTAPEATTASTQSTATAPAATTETAAQTETIATPKRSHFYSINKPAQQGQTDNQAQNSIFADFLESANANEQITQSDTSNSQNNGATNSAEENAGGENASMTTSSTEENANGENAPEDVTFSTVIETGKECASKAKNLITTTNKYAAGRLGRAKPYIKTAFGWCKTMTFAWYVGCMTFGFLSGLFGGGATLPPNPIPVVG